jgi:hypothetical protein
MEQNLMEQASMKVGGSVLPFTINSFWKRLITLYKLVLALTIYVESTLWGSVNTSTVYSPMVVSSGLIHDL